MYLKLLRIVYDRNNYDRRIIHRLLMESFFMQNPGLLHGQMGIVLALAGFYGKTRLRKVS